MGTEHKIDDVVYFTVDYKECCCGIVTGIERYRLLGLDYISTTYIVNDHNIINGWVDDHSYKLKSEMMFDTKIKCCDKIIECQENEIAKHKKKISEIKENIKEIGE